MHENIVLSKFTALCQNEAMTNNSDEYHNQAHVMCLVVVFITCIMEIIQKSRNSLRKKDSCALENYLHTVPALSNL